MQRKWNYERQLWKGILKTVKNSRLQPKNSLNETSHHFCHAKSEEQIMIRAKKKWGRNSLIVMFAKHKKDFHNLFKTISSQTTPIWINVLLIICYIFILNINWSFLEYFWLYFHYQVYIYCICVLAII